MLLEILLEWLRGTLTISLTISYHFKPFTDHFSLGASRLSVAWPWGRSSSYWAGGAAAVAASGRLGGTCSGRPSFLCCPAAEREGPVN